ncbi:MAG: restriction endonuclease subunit S [Candidatus Omnitrophota bacterium]
MNKAKCKKTEIDGMLKNWQKSLVGEHIELAYGDGLPERTRKKGPIPVFGSNGVTGFHDKALVKGPGIIIGRKGTVGQVVFSKADFWPIDTTYYVKFKGDDDIVFWYYFLSTLGLNQMNSHSAVPGLNRDNVYEITALLPLLLEQRAIAKILSDLDEKIELSRQMNKTLESIAQAIFKRWFVDEDKNSTTGKLGDILEVVESGSRPKGGIDPNLREGIPSIGAENINGIGFYNYSKTKFISSEFFNIMNRGVIEDYDVLVYKDGAYIGRKSMFGKGFPYEQCCVNEHVFILRSNSRANQFFLYFLLNQKELKQLNTNSAQPGLNQESMRSLHVVVPDKIKVGRFAEAVKPLIDEIFFNCNQARVLSQIRDSLLPRLMSGKIRVS